jgi:hypothetical protein
MATLDDRTLSAQQLLDQAVEQLRAMLPPDWQIAPAPSPAGDDASRRVDRVIEIHDSSGTYGRVPLEARTTVAPRDLDMIFGGRLSLLRQLDQFLQQPMIVAPWLSPRTRQLVTERGLNYLDLTGNVRFQLSRPPVLIRTDGAQHDPAPQPRSPLTLKGSQAGRLVRALVDIVPPYTPTQLASAAGVSLSYASRQLTELDRQALIERGPRSQVMARDWAGLLRRRAEHYGVFTTNTARGFIAGTGPRELLDQLDSTPQPIKALTGSFAAAEIAPIAAPGQLVLYVEDPGDTAARLGLLPADRGPDVILLKPYDPVVYDRVRGDAGVRRVAVSQLALDCLTGNGRMPAEGEALLDWMTTTTDWQVPDITQAGLRGAIT